MTAGISNARQASEDFWRALQHHQEGRLREAETLYRVILDRVPEHPWVRHYLAIVLLQGGQLGEAQRGFRAALALEPALAMFHGNYGEALAGKDTVGAALTYRRAIASDPTFSQAYGNLIARCQHLEAWEDLNQFARRHVALEPASASALSNLGLLLCKRGVFDLAESLLTRATSLAPSSVQILLNLGWAQAYSSDPGRAVGTLQLALERDPNAAAAYNNLGRAHHRAGRNGLARAALRRGLSLAPDEPEAHANLGNVALALREHDVAVDQVRRGLALQPGDLIFRGNLIMTLLYLDSTRPEMLRRAVAHAVAFDRPTVRPARPALARSAAGRLRVGFVSGDLFHHPVGETLLTIIEATDRDAADVYLYANAARFDAMTERFRQIAHGWRPISGEDDGVVADRIRGDDLDVLVSVAGHTAGGRLSLFASRLAPVQASLFDLTTSGLKEVDYWVGDGLATPPETTEMFTETLLRLPCWNVFARPPADPTPGPLPALNEGRVTFGCFNNPAKLSSATISAWAEIMRATPDSYLLLRYLDLYREPCLREGLADEFERLGIARSRIEFEQGLAARSDHLGSYRRVDIALDPFPFTGCNATFEALWMGVPVVSLAGPRFIARMGASFLPHVGLTRLVANTVEAYVAAAVTLAADLDTLSTVRRGLRDRVSESPLCDAKNYAKSLLAALDP